MNIGQASSKAGVSAKMIRYYESIGLLPEPDRKESGYRDDAMTDVHRLTFVRRARDLGFSIYRIRNLLLLWSDRDRGNADVRAIANEHIAELQDQGAKLEQMIATLRHLVKSCRGENRDECPIMADLAKGAKAPELSSRKKLIRPADRVRVSYNTYQIFPPFHIWCFQIKPLTFGPSLCNPIHKSFAEICDLGNGICHYLGGAAGSWFDPNPTFKRSIAAMFLSGASSACTAFHRKAGRSPFRESVFEPMHGVATGP